MANFVDFFNLKQILTLRSEIILVGSPFLLLVFLVILLYSIIIKDALIFKSYTTIETVSTFFMHREIYELLSLNGTYQRMPSFLFIRPSP